MTVTSRGADAGGWVRGLCLLGIALGVALRLWLPVALPLGEVVRHRLQGLNDEPAHLRYVEYVATRHALPVQTHRFEEPGAFRRADFEYHQPPLYYLLCAPLYSLAGPSRGMLACRLFSALCGLGTLVLLWRVLRSSSLPGFVTWPVTMFAALWLTPAYFCAVVSNDALSWLLGAAIVAALWARPRGRPSMGRAVALGALLGLGLLTKTTLIVFLPVVAFVGVLESLRERRLAPLAECAAALVLAGLIVSPWYVRNLSVYGSLWGLEWRGTAQPYVGPRPTWEALLVSTSKYFWFPMQHVPVTTASRVLRGVGGLLLVVHGLGALAYFWRRRGSDLREVYLLFAFVAMVGAYAARSFLWFAPEARFLFPALVPLIYGLAGSSELLNANHRRFVFFEMLVFSLLPFAYLALV
jgi:4-amino-4-deoxy-L-arabinose transferase-like glycosyltransferase